MFDRQALKLRLKSLSKPQVVNGHENAALETIIDDILAGLEKEGRQPDSWEANCLHAAMQALGKHRFGLARANLLHALETIRHGEPAHRPAVTVLSLRAELETLRGLPPKGSLKRHGQPHGAAAQA